ncbi:uncharacterized protein BCR38DRAFT_408964 [Pseudomassariella vexata]|uniref:Uncharacterized protein n=1 Tax=Pseudomassariella vexata TaxID=1141098 RepID=A0A1Y2E113_9PEZI|nr:uncharacterized protein BCR38DRAFT_408964 [Pseudomassariella vexata]ORY65243.1 hypothetical protein BCR38DRAFT_408964 [Pseudomassariella vexata]
MLDTGSPIASARKTRATLSLAAFGSLPPKSGRRQVEIHTPTWSESVLARLLASYPYLVMVTVPAQYTDKVVVPSPPGHYGLVSTPAPIDFDFTRLQSMPWLRLSKHLLTVSVQLGEILSQAVMLNTKPSAQGNQASSVRGEPPHALEPVLDYVAKPDALRKWAHSCRGRGWSYRLERYVRAPLVEALHDPSPRVPGMLLRAGYQSNTLLGLAAVYWEILVHEDTCPMGFNPKRRYSWSGTALQYARLKAGSTVCSFCFAWASTKGSQFRSQSRGRDEGLWSGVEVLCLWRPFARTVRFQEFAWSGGNFVLVPAEFIEQG